MKTNNLVIDSSVFISTFHAIEIFHQESSAFFAFLETAKLHVYLPSLVFAETIVSLHKHTIQTQSATQLLLSLPIISFDTSFLKTVLPYAKNTTLKTSDFLIAASAKVYKATLITWDKTLLSDTSMGISAKTPKQFIHHR